MWVTFISPHREQDARYGGLRRNDIPDCANERYDDRKCNFKPDAANIACNREKASLVSVPSAKLSILPVANAAKVTTIINSTVAGIRARRVALLTAFPPPSLSSLRVLMASNPRKLSAATEIAVAIKPCVNH